MGVTIEGNSGTGVFYPVLTLTEPFVGAAAALQVVQLALNYLISGDRQSCPGLGVLE